MAASIPIYTGFWLDKSYDSAVLGATLTLPIRQANYLVTFLALLVTICATFVWTIAAFLLHQLLARSGFTDVLGLQVQVILRNAGSPGAAAWHGVKLLLAWRHGRPSRFLSRIAAVVAPGILVSFLFLTAGIFVADIATKSSEYIPALAEEGACGHLEFNVSDREAIAAFSRKDIGDTIGARQYASNW